MTMSFFSNHSSTFSLLSRSRASVMQSASLLAADAEKRKKKTACSEWILCFRVFVRVASATDMHASFYVHDYASPKMYFCIGFFYYYYYSSHLNCCQALYVGRVLRVTKETKNALVHHTRVCAISLGCHEGPRTLSYISVKRVGVAAPCSQSWPKSSTPPQDETVRVEGVGTLCDCFAVELCKVCFFSL